MLATLHPWLLQLESVSRYNVCCRLKKAFLVYIRYLMRRKRLVVLYLAIHYSFFLITGAAIINLVVVVAINLKGLSNRSPCRQTAIFLSNTIILQVICLTLNPDQIALRLLHVKWNHFTTRLFLLHLTGAPVVLRLLALAWFLVFRL